MNIQHLANQLSQHKETKDVLIQIIEYLKANRKKPRVDEIKFLLKLMRHYISRENKKSEDQKIYLWKEIDITDLKRIKTIQDTLLTQELTGFLYEFLKNRDDEVVRESLMLSLAYLYGGNRAVQEQYYNEIASDDENTLLIFLYDKLVEKHKQFKKKELERVEMLYTQT
eukprot:CAMPEP_0114584094 /NCGR_PEP_ID=MMETSP0125-20121206/7807_1 /TAXON_ID=485358 ORGANISM="Aristerostoma sp., Strain ATCC 50986" /NCGR_SAMPLE_ID=MMETSP0125 /ASSEMBLY_ACC=CAM_ASM_000245 /LENGTH=168 /DNA_ID=CAMNT_0001778167 /DNA_START=5745 /DNA_END=6251 /DNA_ORIENTATION=+